MPDNNFLPQSALPIGQTPVDVIRAPQVPTNIPSPIDVTNFFRMQQGIQGNLQLLQGVEALKLRKQQLDLDTYESMISDVDAIMGMTDNLVNRQYAQHKGNKENTEPTDIFAGLDDTNTAHYAIKQKLQPKIDAEQKRAQDIGIALLKSGSKDPAVRAEALRGIQQSQSNIQRIIMDDPDFKKYKKQSYNYDLWHDRVTNPDSDLRKDYTVDPNAVAALEDKYRKFVNGETDKYGNPIVMRDEDFSVDKYFYNSKKVLGGLQADSKVISQGTTSIVQQQRPDGSIVPVEHTVRPSREEAIDLLLKKWSTDPDAQKMANATGISLRDLAANTYNVEHPTGTEDVITDIGTLIKAPEGSTAGGYKSMFGDTAGAEELRQVEADLVERGLDPKGTPMSRVQIGKLNAAYADPEKNVVEIPVNDKGEEVDDVKDATRIKFVDRVTTPAVTKRGKVVTPEKVSDVPIAEFPKVKATPPKSTVDSEIVKEIDNLQFKPRKAVQLVTLTPAEKIAAVESNGDYKAVNPDSSATGKYQFLWNTHKDKIKEITGVDSKEDFKNNPDAQEKYFEYVNKNQYAPAIEHIQASQDFPNLGIDDDSLRYMLHFMGTEKNVKDFLKTGKFVIYGKDYTKDALKAFELYGNETNTDLIGSLRDHFAAEATTGGMHTLSGDNSTNLPGFFNKK